MKFYCGLKSLALSILVSLLIFSSYAVPVLAEQQSSCLLNEWPSEHSDLQPDPSLKRGVLANGFRYILKQNEEPKNRVALYLLVNAGSFNETPEQRGSAHFLEHMMFNGTENFPPGSLVDYFQSIGMAFGGDTNAFTTYDRTVYTIVLPDGEKEDFDSGLLVMSDYAGRALLLEDEIDRERGVILAEKRSRDSAEYRTYVATTEYAFKGTLMPERQVIGVDETLRQANRNILKSYYDSWYRPDNMALVVVGDFEESLATELIQKHFGQLATRTDGLRCPDFGTVGKKIRDPFYLYEPELGKTDVSIEFFDDLTFENDSREVQKRELIRFISSVIMGYRLQKAEEEKDQVFTRGAYYSGDLVDRIRYSVISGEAKNNSWQQTLIALESLRRQAEEFGFLPGEVERAKKQILAELEANVLTEKSRDSREIGRDIVDHLASNRVYMSPKQELELYGGMLKKLNLAEINKEFRKNWQNGNLLVSVTGDTTLKTDPSQFIADVYQDVSHASINPPDDYSDIEFPYLQVAAQKSGEPEITNFADIDAKRYTFPNGLIVNLKKTDYEKDLVKISAVFGNGELAEPRPGMALLSERIINDSGTGKLSQATMDRLVAGTTVNLGFHVGETSFSWNGEALGKDFKFLVQILYTLLYDPGFRESVYSKAMVKTESMYKKLASRIDGAFPMKIQKFIAGDSDRFGLPPLEKLKALTYSDLLRWVQTTSPPNDLEISVVGDFAEEEIITILSHYFGGEDLGTRNFVDAPEVKFPDGKRLVVPVPTTIKKSMVVIAWPTVDGKKIERSRRLNVLAAVLEDRILERLREKLGAAYSPDTYSFTSRVYTGYGYIMSQMIVDPGKVQMVTDEVMKISRDLGENGITEDELIRARDPMVTSIKDTVATNRYWLHTVLNMSSRYPEQLEWAKNILSDYSGINKDEIDALAKEFLQQDAAAVAVANPEDIANDQMSLVRLLEH